MSVATSNKATILNNKKWVLKQRPKGKFDASKDAELVEEPITVEDLPEESLVVEVHALSIDAFIRTMLDEKSNPAHGAIDIQMPIPALGYGKVVKGNSKFKEGSIVQGMLKAGTYAVIDDPSKAGLMAKMTLPRADPHSSLSVLGISGVAAYVGMFVSPSKGPQKGETVVVSAAAGAVGCLAAQMAKLSGARVVGIAGGTKKKGFLLDELKLDAVVDYKCEQKSIGEQLDETCPDGIDFFFDNVGGDILDEVLQRINLHSRISICGVISQYDCGNINNKHAIKGPSHYCRLAETSSTMSGFNMMHYSSHFLKAFGYLAWHYYRGSIACPEHVENGIETFGKSLEMSFSGGHHGRLIVDLVA